MSSIAAIKPRHYGRMLAKQNLVAGGVEVRCPLNHVVFSVAEP